MGSRRFVVLGAVTAAALLAGLATASADPSVDTSDRRAVQVHGNFSAKQSSSRAAIDPVASKFVPMNPLRMLDTRTSGGPLGTGGVRTVDLSGVTPVNASAVVLNVTGTEPTGSTFVSVYPASEPRSTVSTLNLVKGQTRANQVTVALGPDRKVSLFNNWGNTHLVVDVSGYYVPDTGSLYNAVAPGRVLDTRSSGRPVGPGGTVDLSFPWLDGSATAVTLNVTAVNATSPTYVSVYPSGSPKPNASNLNVVPGEIVPNQVTVQLGTNKTIKLLNGNGNVHLVVDMVGYYSTSGGDWFWPITPERAFDTRPGNGLDPSVIIVMDGFGDASTGPGAITTVVGNLTGTNADTAQYVVVFPGGQDIPLASNLNLVAGQTAANAVTVGVGYEPAVGYRTINFANNYGYVDIIFDVSGFFLDAPPV